MEHSAPEDLPEGKDFEFLFRRHTAPFSSWINAEKQDLMYYRWEGGPIEFLFVDAAKSWSLTNQILRGFGESLVPGKSRVILQDFRFWHTYWLPLIFDSRRDIWEETESIESGTTVSFRPLKPLFGPCGITLPYSDDGFPMDSASVIFRSRIQRETSSSRVYFVLGFYRKALVTGSKAEADVVREEFKAEIAAAGLLTEVAKVEDLADVLLSQGWQRFEEGAFDEAADLACRCLGGSKPHYAQELLAWALMRLGRFAEAEVALEKALQFSPEWPQAYLHRARLRLAQHRYKEAGRDAADAARLCGGDERILRDALSVLHMTYDAPSGIERALHMFEEFAASYPKSPIVRFWLGHVLDLVGRRDEAIASLRLVIQLDPDFEDARHLLAMWGVLPQTPAPRPPA
jgi:tetratricopeptide (TPR) repeat protein